MKKIKILLLSIAIILLILCMSSCNTTKSYKVYFDLNEDSSNNYITTDGKSLIELPINPKKDNKYFQGWFWDNNSFIRPFNQYSLISSPISKDINVYAKWETQNYSISFDSVGGSDIESISKDFGERIEEPDQPIKTGYNFDGWYEETQYKNLFCFNIMPTENITLYAKWIPFPSTLGLKYELMENDTYNVGWQNNVNTKDITTISLPETYNGKSITKIATSGFESFLSLETIIIPKSIIEIGARAFYNCKNLRYIHFANENTMKRIGNSAFCDCINLAIVDLPKSLVTIGSAAFSGCEGLTSLSLPFVGAKASAQGSESLFGYIFGITQYDYSIKTVQYFSPNENDFEIFYIPKKLRTIKITGDSDINYGAFYNCIMLECIIIPEDIENIGENVFYNCILLEN